MTRGNSGARRALAVVAGFGLVAGAVVPAAASGSSESGAQSKVSPQVHEQLRSDGDADVWLHFGPKADLSAASSMSWADRGQFVYDALNSVAESSQAAVRAKLDAAGADYESFYIVNAIKVSAADAALVRSFAATSEVDAILPEWEVELVEPVTREAAGAAPQAVEWGVQNINAPQVWEQYGATGEGITVASIDSGVEYDHPALVRQYRGNDGSGFDHDHNWFDPQYGGQPNPVDTDGHGTHVTGTMVGDDGAGNQIGVAPGASWIATSGCCPTDVALLDSMEWILAPADLDGENPDPALRPHVVNNSWGTVQPSNDAFGEESQQAWAAAGIFGVFSGGNTGPRCQTPGSPGSRTVNYSVGAYGTNNLIAGFSARGTGQDGTVKPNISAPGVNIRSAYPGDGYRNVSGTSMASPHVAGAVALLWSAAPDLVGDVEGTRALLDQTAINTQDLQCGGDAGLNNVYGEGRLDVLAAVEEAVGEQPPVVQVDRYWGEDRYGTAADVSSYYGDDVDTVYVTTGQAFADSLAGSPAAARGLLGTMNTPEGDPAPVLLVRQNQVPRATAAALSDLDPDNIVILGNENAVSGDIEEGLEDDGYAVRRIGGDDRYHTAALLAAEFDSPPVIYVAVGSGDNYADALSGSALAGRDGGPIVLVHTDRVPQATAEVIEANPQARVVVLGGERAVNGEVYEQVGADARLWGEDRYRTALQVSAQYESAEVVYVATGLDYPDALAGGALAGSQSVPVLMVRGTDEHLDGRLGREIQAELARLDPSRVVVLGGERAVTEEIADDIADGFDD